MSTNRVPGCLALAAAFLLALPGTSAARSTAAERAQAVAAMRGDDFLAHAPGAPMAVVAAVTGQRSYWSADHRLILTDVKLATRRVLRGTVPQVVSLTVEGGEVGDVGLKVSESPRFESGATYAVLLEPAPTGFQVHGRASGLKRVGSADPARDADVRALELVLRHAPRPKGAPR